MDAVENSTIQIVLSELKIRLLQRYGDRIEHLVPLSTLVLSSEAYTDLLHRERRIALDIQSEGIPL